ncbi:DUF6978 family protein [Actinomadura nitritigenes]|uniref:DUF6978 family protein n=1 Tax=Actinomadura nitritigenes TaxID=134602 RepID=UPI003D932D6E
MDTPLLRATLVTGLTVGGAMLEQWEADRLLTLRKVYSRTATIDLSLGADADYPLESDDGREFFILDIWRGRRNKRKVRFQLRYERSLILARLCTSVPHHNPDGEAVGMPHLHKYREGYEDKYAEKLDEFNDPTEALILFCKAINLPAPDVQGGVIS